MKTNKFAWCLSVLFILLAFAAGSFAGDDGKINLNTATKEQLVSVGLDEGMADQVLELREENGEFVDMEELLDVDGMTPRLLRKIKKLLFIKPSAGCNC